MEQIFGEGVLQMIPHANGFVFIVRQGEYADKAIIVYKEYNLQTRTVSPVARSVYQIAKYGSNYSDLDEKPKDFLNARTAALPDHRTLVVQPLGEAVLYDFDGSIRWTGRITYQDGGPDDFAVEGRYLWASFPHANAVLRYSLRTLREELRVGGQDGKIIGRPEGLCFTGERLLVCASQTNRILEIDPKSYVVSDYWKFDEPVHKYLKLGTNEYVLLDSGIYEL